MRILCWNLGAAYGRWHHEPSLHERAWNWIAALDPDVALLQEVRAPEWAADRWSLIVGPYTHFASAIVSKPAISIEAIAVPTGGTLDRFGSYLATAELALNDGSSLLLASVHST